MTVQTLLYSQTCVWTSPANTIFECGENVSFSSSAIICSSAMADARSDLVLDFALQEHAFPFIG